MEMENFKDTASGDTMSNVTCGCHKTKERSEKEYKDLLNRLSRIEGQVRGIKNMVEKNAYCTDILMQVSAVNAALNSFCKVTTNSSTVSSLPSKISCVTHPFI